MGYDCPQPFWVKASCGAGKLALSCAPFVPPVDAVCPEQLYQLIDWGFNEPRFFFLAERLITEDFQFIDETTGQETQGRAYEMALVDSLQCYYLGVEFDFQISSRATEGGCEVACGMVFMRLYNSPHEGLIVNDQTCMSACPDEAGQWRLASWRILRSLPPALEEEGFEGASWGEAKARASEQYGCADF